MTDCAGIGRAPAARLLELITAALFELDPKERVHLARRLPFGLDYTVTASRVVATIDGQVVVDVALEALLDPPTDARQN